MILCHVSISSSKTPPLLSLSQSPGFVLAIDGEQYHFDSLEILPKNFRRFCRKPVPFSLDLHPEFDFHNREIGVDPNQSKKVCEIEVDQSQGADSREFSTRNQSLNRSREASSSPLLHVFLGF